jgi:O-antigen ligase
MIRERSLQEFVATGDRRLVAVVIGLAVALIGGLIGLSLALLGPIITVGLIGALAVTLWALTNLEAGLWGMIAIIALLPFGALPVKIVLTPTFLDLAMGGVILVYLLGWMTGQRRRLATTPVHGLLLAFIILTLFSFVAGLRYAGLTSNVLRHFAELLLSMAFVFLIVDAVQDVAFLRRLVLVIMLAGAAAAALGIVLYALPDSLAERILTSLSVFGYPDGGVIRYIEDNPDLPERAISTSVDPNSLGGLLVMVAALTAPQLTTRYPITGKRWHAIPILLVLVVCLVLTFSRGSLVAFGTALAFIGAGRYRKLLAVLVVVGVLLLALPFSQVYVEHLVEAFQVADLATQMRVGEYGDALVLISRYPLFGVGFAGTPDIDIYLGVACVYLTIAESMGLVGLAAFLVLMGGVFAYAASARRAVDQTPGLRAIWLGLLAGLVGALTGGVVDHYFFNIDFHHAITIFWMFVGLTLAATRLALQAKTTPTVR